MGSIVTRAVDLFGGFGGFTEGAKRAGVQVVYAANHWPLAVETHAANHPEVEHECQDLMQKNWTELPEYDVLLASPACQGHSAASQPSRQRYHDDLRMTAWAVVDCAEATLPATLVVENVVAFQRWQLFGLWTAALEKLGYTLSIGVVRASYVGVPQRRDRLFIVGRRDGRRMKLTPKVRDEPSFRDCIDDSAAGWRDIASCRYPGARGRLRRVSAELGRGIAHHVTDCPVVSLDGPLPTITTKHQWALVDGESYRQLTAREIARGMGFPESYRWDTSLTQAVRGLGNAVPPPVGQHVVSRAVA